MQPAPFLQLFSIFPKNSHWLGFPDNFSVVVSRTVIVTCRPDFGLHSPSCGTAYTGLTLRALLNSSRSWSTDGLWICSMMSCDRPGLAFPFTCAAALDWLTSRKSGRFSDGRNDGKVKNSTHVCSRFWRRSVRYSSPVATSPIHLNFHLLPIHCRCCTPSAEALMFVATNWKSAKLTSAECCCTFHLTSCFHRPEEWKCFSHYLAAAKTRGRFSNTIKRASKTWCEMSTRVESHGASTWKCLAAIFRKEDWASRNPGFKWKFFCAFC
jgi:hypothetical protein